MESRHTTDYKYPKGRKVVIIYILLHMVAPGPMDKSDRGMYLSSK